MMRIGFGFDSHRFVPGRALVLAGVEVDYCAGLSAHSDGDVVLHALADAVFGAVGAGDIGEHFPDTDPRWARADSSVFVAEALRLAGLAGYAVGNCDITILAEAPRLGPVKAQMASNIAGLLKIPPGRVSIKAKTAEGMGLVGRREGLACYAVVLLVAQAGLSDENPAGPSAG